MRMHEVSFGLEDGELQSFSTTTPDGDRVRFDGEAYRFALSRGLYDPALTFSSLIYRCFGPRSSPLCRFYRDPEDGERSLVFEVALGHDVEENAGSIEDFRKQSIRAIPWEQSKYIGIVYYIE